jgi:hypothetical protein
VFDLVQYEVEHAATMHLRHLTHQHDGFLAHDALVNLPQAVPPIRKIIHESNQTGVSKGNMFGGTMSGQSTVPCKVACTKKHQDSLGSSDQIFKCADGGEVFDVEEDVASKAQAAAALFSALQPKSSVVRNAISP